MNVDLKKLFPNEVFPDLKPCPFCGREARIYIVDEDDRSLHAHISCGVCYVNYDNYLAHGSREPANLNKALELINGWNTRV